MQTYTLTSTKENKYQLAINGVVIPDEILEANNLEWDDREGYIEHLEDCAKNSYAEGEKKVAKTLDEEILLLTRNSLGAQEMIHPHSKSFAEICEKIIKLSQKA